MYIRTPSLLLLYFTKIMHNMCIKSSLLWLQMQHSKQLEKYKQPVLLLQRIMHKMCTNCFGSTQRNKCTTNSKIQTNTYCGLIHKALMQRIAFLILVTNAALEKKELQNTNTRCCYLGYGSKIRRISRCRVGQKSFENYFRFSNNSPLLTYRTYVDGGRESTELSLHQREKLQSMSLIKVNEILYHDALMEFLRLQVLQAVAWG